MTDEFKDEYGRKRFRSTASETDELTNTSTAIITMNNVVYEGLRIVLQYWLIPDMGWNENVFIEHIPQLRETLINARSAAVDTTISLEAPPVNRQCWKELGFIDQRWFDIIMKSIDDIPDQEIITLAFLEVSK